MMRQSSDIFHTSKQNGWMELGQSKENLKKTNQN